MNDLDAALDAHRRAVADFLASADRCASVWHTPRAPGKWSPAQLSEHVARSLDESANEVAGLPSRFPSFPGLLRVVARGLFFNRVLKTQAFPKARTRPAFDPEEGPESPKAARARIEAAASRLEQACRDRARSGGTVRSGLFGAVPVSQYAQFQALHTRHHAKQLPAG